MSTVRNSQWEEYIWLWESRREETGGEVAGASAYVYMYVYM